jgi:molybdopterin synthase catalytic subunit
VDKTVVLTRKSLSLEEALARVSGPGRGAVLSFSGRVRGMEGRDRIRSITYEAYGALALREMRAIVRRTKKRWPVLAAVRHRTGKVRVGEPSLVVACGGAHRAEAFAACRYLVDEIKRRAPLWKTKFEKAP